MTSTVLLMPVAAVWLMSSGGITTSLPLLVFSAILASVVVGIACRAAWSRHRESQDVLFADLMLWRWVQRWWAERKLSSVMTRLGIDEETMGHEEAVNLNFDALRDLAAALEARDPYTHGHSRRVARYAAMIAKNLGLDEREVAKIRTAAAVHDVGKLEVPLEVLNKAGRLTDEEFELIKVHAPRGAELVAKLGDEELTEIVAHHHERLDGSGYPDRIGGERIPLGARIIAVADTFDALTSTRAYRPARSHAEALAILHAEAGTQLDLDAVHAFDRYYDGGLASWIAWPMLISLPHRLWTSTGAQAQAVGSSIATG
ncbi:MAG: HD-GYP domain-containing protein, partial [Solirubrobacterales bacterium]